MAVAPDEQRPEPAGADGPADAVAAVAAADRQRLEGGRDRPGRRRLVEARRADATAATRSHACGSRRSVRRRAGRGGRAAVGRRPPAGGRSGRRGPVAPGGHDDGRSGRHEPDERDADQRCGEEHEGGRPPAGRRDDARRDRQRHGDADTRAGVREPERQPGDAGVAPGDGRRRADERELEAHRVERGVGEDHDRDVGREVDREPAAGVEDHRRGEQVAVGELVVGPAEERARDRGDDEEHRPRRDRQGPADPEVVGEGDRERRERVQPAVRDRADDERADERQRDAGRAARAADGHAEMLPVDAVAIAGQPTGECR